MLQLGDGTNADKNLPSKVSGIDGWYSTISAGSYHTCVGASAVSVICWGNNRSGQLGYGYRSTRAVPEDLD